MLNFELEPEEAGRLTKLTMTARFRPRGLLGLLYWYAVVPLHDFVFGGMLKGIRQMAESLNHASRQADLPSETATPVSSGYGRARLWLGISAVGTLVTLSALGLIFDVPGSVRPQLESLGLILGLVIFVLMYVMVQLPFDLLGGYVLPRAHNRCHPPLVSYLLGLARGVIVHATIMLAASVAIAYAGKYGGIAGTVSAGGLIILALLIGRVAIASLVARLKFIPGEGLPSHAGLVLPVAVAESADEGFTGAVAGVLQPSLHIIPAKWREVLGPKGLQVAASRRDLAVRSGSWWRGRAVALLFTMMGLLLSACLVGSDLLGTAVGTIEFSMWFTLWSFGGLLTLPTLSRRGVIEVDDRAEAEGATSRAMRETAQKLDLLQDGEPVRPSFVEAIFHPIPSVQSRLDGPRSHGLTGFWDAARTAIYLSLAGLGLLGRAVHCNCGRPSLWVFLPID